MNDYRQSFYLEGDRGNNALSYALRGPSPRLYVPSVKIGGLQDVREGLEVVFEDYDEFGVLQRCKGLEYFVRAEWEGIPLVVVDNHNHVFYFWLEMFLKKRWKEGAFLVHIDEHKDMREPPTLFNGATLEEGFLYVNEVLNVGNYIVPALEMGLLKEVQLVTSEVALEDKSFFGKGPKILNIDLDFFAPEMDYISFEKTKHFILAHARESNLITVATSPFFIDQNRAFEKLQNLFGVDRR